MLIKSKNTNKNTHAIVCTGGWKYVGKLLDVNISLLGIGKLQWFKLQTKRGIILINADHVVSVLEYDNRKTITT